jgi:hypothetical protein
MDAARRGRRGGDGGRRVIAQFADTCVSCRRPIAKGAEIVRARNGWSHQSCFAPAPEYPPSGSAAEVLDVLARAVVGGRP